MKHTVIRQPGHARRVPAFFLAFATMLFVMALGLPLPTQAAEVTVTDEADFKSAIANATEDTTITLPNGLGLTDKIVISDGRHITLKGGSITSGAGTYLALSGTGTQVTIDGTTISGSTDSAITVTDGASLTINSGTFENNIAQTGAVIKTTNATVIVNGGTFQNNQARSGGVIMSGDQNDYANEATNQSKVTINAGTFTGNHATQSLPLSNSNGTVVVQKDTQAWHQFSGGGAIWSNGNLTVHGGTFTNNEAYGCYGGAIFINGGTNTPKASITAGEFASNTSTQLGGAIYSEENSQVLYGEAVVYSNKAGHFGGGVWLCPSGVGSNGQNGAAAIFDNTAAIDADGNKNLSTSSDILMWSQLHGTNKTGFNNRMDIDNYFGGAAGNDLSVMYPNKSSAAQEASFELSENWFNGTSVTWTEDGRPTKGASGYEYKKTWPGYNNDQPYSGMEVNSTISRLATLTDTSTATTYSGTFVPKSKDYGLAVQATGISEDAKTSAKAAASLSIHDNTA